MASSSNIGVADFYDLFLNGTQLLDVRAPVEFAAGAFPNATNHPILDDVQRHEIGCVFADHGQEAAISRGLELASPRVRAQRIEAWLAHSQRYSDGYLYCFRGGFRSHIAQQWLQEAGVDYPLVEGGYKSLRRFLLNQLNRLAEGNRLMLVAGATAVGKTDLLNSFDQSIDLEGHARHRGSAFGAVFEPQPSQVDFENRVIINWLRQDAVGHGPILIEAESRLIGRLNLPVQLQTAMRNAPIIRLTASHGQRVQRLRRDYIQFALDHYNAESFESDAAWQKLHASVRSSLDKISKRLGGLQHQRLCQMLPGAIEQLKERQDWGGFDLMFEQLLTSYYDKLYDYQLNKQEGRIVFSGEHDEVLQWLHERKNNDG